MEAEVKKYVSARWPNCGAFWHIAIALDEYAIFGPKTFAFIGRNFLYRDGKEYTIEEFIEKTPFGAEMDKIEKYLATAAPDFSRDTPTFSGLYYDTWRGSTHHSMPRINNSNCIRIESYLRGRAEKYVLRRLPWPIRDEIYAAIDAEFLSD